MITFLTEMIGGVNGVIIAAIATAAAAYVASVWWKTKALVPTMTSIVLAAVVVWASSNVDLLQEQVEEDANAWLGEAPE